MKIAVIVAVAENNGIGKDNQLLWHLPADLKQFKQLTTGHTIIMGRKTFESIGKALPNRRNIVLTTQKNFAIDGVEVFNNIADALLSCENDETVFIIGGAKIYEQTLWQADLIYITRVHVDLDADTFFPELDQINWKIVSSRYFPADEKNKYAFTFETLQRC